MTGTEPPADAHPAVPAPVPAPRPGPVPGPAAPSPSTDPGPSTDSGPSTDAAAPEPPAGPVADTVRALADLDALPLSAHPETYQRIHADLQGALADIDDA